MKKRLFAAVVSLSFYILFVAGFSMADNSGQIPQVLSKFGLTNDVAFASLAQDVFDQGRLIDPAPEPRRPKLIDPAPEPRRPKLIDPAPEPRRPKLIDPAPEPRRPK